MTKSKDLAIVSQEQARQPAGIFDRMCARYGIRNPSVLCVTLREQWTSEVSNKISDNQIGAFLVVADQYGLNPLTKEIYAFPSKGGAIVPMLGIDGWITIANNHPSFDGFDFKDIAGPDGKLNAIECVIYRKDRSRPAVIREYLSECRRDTIPWKQSPARMLRHRAFMQCARYAFGFTGLAMEGDEIDGEVLTLANVAIPEGGHEEMPRRTARQKAIDQQDQEILDSAARAAAAREQEEAERLPGDCDPDFDDSAEPEDELPDARISAAAEIKARLMAMESVVDLNACWAANRTHIEALPDELRAMLDEAKADCINRLKNGAS